jgi:zinc protease
MRNLSRILFTLLFIVINFNLLAIVISDTTTTALTDSIDPKVILDKYVNSIGGKDAILKIDDRTIIMRGTAMGQSITLIVKQKAPNKLRQEVKAGTMEQLVICDGEKAIMKMMDQKIEVKDKELEALLLEANIDFLTDPEKFGIKLSYAGIEKVNDKDAYKIKMILPSGLIWYAYFDKESGLKVKEDREIETKMGRGQQSITYDDYKDVNGVKYPFKMVQSFGGQSVDVTVSSIKVNKGLSNDLFVIPDDK